MAKKHDGMSHDDAVDSISDAGMAGFGLGPKKEDPARSRVSTSTRSVNHHEAAPYNSAYTAGSRGTQYGGGRTHLSRQSSWDRESFGGSYGDDWSDADYDRAYVAPKARQVHHSNSGRYPGITTQASVDAAMQASVMEPHEKLAWHVRKAQEHLMDAMDASGFIVTSSTGALQLKAMIDHDMAKMLKQLLADAEEFGHVRKVQD